MSSHSDERATEMRDLFFQSAQELLQALNEQGLALEKDAANREAVREIRRVVHTLKGDSAACGFRELSDLAHELEDVLSPEIAASNAASLPEIVLSAADMFDAMCAAYRARLDPPNGDPLRAMIWRMAQQPSAPKVLGKMKPSFAWTEYEQLAMAEAAGRGLHVYEIAVAIEAGCPLRAAGIALLKKVLQEAGTLLASSLEEARWADAGQVEFAIASDRDQHWLSNKCRLPGVVAQVAVEKFVPALELTHEDVAAATTAAAPSAVGSTQAAAAPPNHHGAPDAAVNRIAAYAENTLRVDAERIDNLLDLVGELVIGKSMLHQLLHEFTSRSPKDPLRAKFADALAFQSQVLNALQRSAMKIRMVPVDQLFRRFPRLVRDVAKLCGKDVTLEMSGQETDLDKGLLDALAEPLVHLIRNAVDHGIETPSERSAAGKPEQGAIRLHACHQGNQVVIEISDDGHGIDAAAVLAKAVSRGLATPDQAARMSETDAVEFIFEPGFSTAERISEISGRGVGMDVVKTALQKLKGNISIETHPGRGTTFQLRLPLTLAIIRAMLFRVAERLYAIPLESVLEIARASEADIHRVDSHEVLQLRNEVLTLVRLNRLAPAATGHEDGRVFVIVIGSGERKFGLVVDKLVGEEELVIKPLDETVVASELVSGASILGDGTVVLILNVGEVLRKFARARLNPASIPAAGNGRSMEATA
ncbi:MAG: chemotaxis protein CheA [Acidobacteriia bacterium]|nr:chemotaxis protein CheA [Terriglobia bacterium]